MGKHNKDPCIALVTCFNKMYLQYFKIVFKGSSEKVFFTVVPLTTYMSVNPVEIRYGRVVSQKSKCISVCKRFVFPFGLCFSSASHNENEIKGVQS